MIEKPSTKRRLHWNNKWVLGILFGIFVGGGMILLGVLGSFVHQNFGTTVCKIKETKMLLVGTIITLRTEYYLVDEHGTRLSVDSTVWNSLTSIPDCSNTGK